MSTPRDRGMAQFLLIITAFCVTIQSCNSDGCSINYPQTCGYLNINYPFNIQGSNCGHSNFSLLCKRNSTFGQGSIPFLSTPTGEFQVLNLSYNSLLINISHLKAISCNVSQSAHEFFSLPRDGPFTISGSNVFASVGCYTNGSFFPTALQSRVGGMCGASCLKIYQPEYCNGFGCCQIGLIENWRSVNFSVQPPSGECVFSTILDPTTFKIQVPDKGRFGAGTYGLKIDWGFKAENCSSANQMGNLTCSRHAHCLDVTGMPGYKVCRCDEGYEGDGYQEGVQCTDINECDIFQNECILPPVGRCVNMNGSYACFCAKGKGDGKTSCTDDSILAPLLIGIFTSLVGGPLIAGALFWVVKKRKQVLMRRKYFLQNKGLLLQEYISSDRGRRKVTIFSEAELVKATNNFSEDLKVGVGGFGNVYQGKLAEGRLVAIKKCKDVDEEHIKQFINEVIVLSQIDHRNIIKLLGCCLETRIPLLVYEYVSNGTLFDHLHGKDGTKFLTWDKRLQITTETAEAVAYLHSSASVQIVHRDIKSANILLDSTYSVKLSDFGLSRLMPTGNTHLTTGVKGTLGYVDPQYYKTVELTSKTDIYSFGVVMVELLTSMKAMSVDRAKEERILADLFLSRKGQSLVAELFDTRLVEKDQMESMTSVANLAEACLNEDVNMRPSMKEILQELLLITSSNTTGVRRAHSWVNKNDLKIMNEEEKSVPFGSQETSYKTKQPLRFNVKCKVFHSSPVINTSFTI